MSTYASDDELPELGTLLAPRPLMATSTNPSVRRSPRKKSAPTLPNAPQKTQCETTIPPKPMHADVKRTRSKPQPAAKTKKPTKASVVDAFPALPRNSSAMETSIISNNRRSPVKGRTHSRITNVDSLLLPMKVMAVEEQSPKMTVMRPLTSARPAEAVHSPSKSIMSLMTEAARKIGTNESRTKKQCPSYASRFVLNEARCNDDAESSMDEEDEDEDTDLSGFIVDDDAELSYQDSAESGTETDHWRSRIKSVPRQAPRRRLQQGRRNQRRIDSSDHESNSEKENNPTSELFDAMRNMRLHEGADKAKAGVVEVIDLTSSPPASPEAELNTQQNGKATLFPHPETQKQRSSSSNPFDDFDTILRLAPPSSKPNLVVPSKSMAVTDPPSLAGEDPHETAADAREDAFKTPPATPPRSPSKLKSPSKQLSPSKRQVIPRSPHRQSMDDFWDHNVINEWIDEYSPKKAPATSPRKQGLARFQIWSDSEEDDQDQGESTPLPSPFSSPRKSRANNHSPVKSPGKEEKKRLLDQKRAALAKKKDFDSRKEQLAVELLDELDTSVAGSQLAKLALSTGGVRIVWSKTLRSTAGRANWKRTVTKLSGSPVKGGEVAGQGVKVEHFASIELAEKIVDCEDRLVSTVAHEFCHLTNFMISNVRDQPHGASFKQWAEKVTSHLRGSGVDIWRKVEVTTKHSYVINHKYLWVCVGREQTPAMNFLNINDEDGCGAEYGRHSKSIDPEKHRCGKCKGTLVQVRPKPRASPAKKSRMLFTREDTAESARSSSTAESNSSGTGTLATMTEVVELSD
ncbi:hypothetical protein LTR10_017791 [Elasticomyces elasticus]|uniref:SprT-like domain-containing protein n=1 Tax=Exophiala sideris TaxID=1016849 RepID=A0ABR0JC72_9EURO|nr:hypothetical protein LTR10_017791 [Elasticomyces elasticus]KAK5031301.1 hypothetical protein LTS07_005036 [Exophiala sideris]KAK5039021.1 hypothetical protein LTR13_004052 [Exophiala sideris]KAK5060906.1 hypothetical protein LTR69_005505 [Exophiala sideris]KAK5183817.1 hypothetical protein LTR44_004099 [Eurotiomycetes sp. CCFEE 6388]